MKTFNLIIPLLLVFLPLNAGACFSNPTGSTTGTSSTLSESFLDSTEKFYLNSGYRAEFNFDLAHTGNKAYLYNSKNLIQTANASPDITGYNQKTSTITSAKLFFSFKDDSYCFLDWIETGKIKVYLDGITLSTNKIEWDTNRYWINLNNYLGNLQDGSLKTAVIETAGDVYLTDVTLEADVKKNPTPTPIPAAAWLLGSGLLGLIGLKRKTTLT
jgi:hypothetical protein